MLSKKLAFGACLLLIGTVFATEKTYTVRKGDTIHGIAKRFDVAPRELIKKNHLQHRHLFPGMVLTIEGDAEAAPLPPSTECTVLQGDSSFAIAHRKATTVEVLKALNPDVDLDDLKAGTKIRVPVPKIDESDDSDDSSDAPEVSAIIISRFAEVTAEHAIIRRDARADADSITMVDAGTRATVLDYQNGWYKLMFPKGTVGWMRADLLKAAQGLIAANDVHAPKQPEFPGVNDPTIKRLMRTAYSLRGVPYVYGGMSCRGTDCSGFTSMVYRSAGISLPRVSRSQATTGYAVNRGQLKPGDLIFFRTGRSSRINHVGMYIGDGKFIHAASNYGEVKLENFAGHYSMVFAAARRVAVAKSKPRVAKATEIHHEVRLTAMRSVPMVAKTVAARVTPAAAKTVTAKTIAVKVARSTPKTITARTVAAKVTRPLVKAVTAKPSTKIAAPATTNSAASVMATVKVARLSGGSGSVTAHHAIREADKTTQ